MLYNKNSNSYCFQEVIKTLKYSRQRKCIKSFLIGRTDHPTADTVYMHVRQQYPNISLGTVYRNLTLLSDIGEISRIDVGDGVDRFDADTSTHQHIVCNSCGCVQDICLPETEKILEYANTFYDGIITTQTINFRGICSDCLKNSNSN